MTEIIAVRFKAGGKQYYFDPQGLTVPQGAGVIVETPLIGCRCIGGDTTAEHY